MASWAGTPGPVVGPGPGPRKPQSDIPVDWKGDQQKLRTALYDDCVELLQRDQNRDVRFYALLAVGNLNRPANPDEPFADDFIALLVNRYRQEDDARIRAEIVKSFSLMPNNSDSIRAVLRDGLVDRQQAVRTTALTALTAGGRSKLSFDEARPILEASLKADDAAVRLGAVQALNVFGASSAAHIPVLERMRETDSDFQVRTSAQLAIEAIRRALSAKPAK
jgi:hypothetical protein